MRINKPFSATQIEQLQSLVGAGQLLTDPNECFVYGYDNSRRQAMPDAVVFPHSENEVQAIVKWCNTQGIPLTVRGRGTGTTGATVPLFGGVVLSTEHFTQTLIIDADNRVAVVSPGVTNQAVQDAAGKAGFFWPPDPTSAAFCTIGGNLAYNSAGPRAVKYGTPRENTLGLRAITGSGEVIKTGSYTTKGVVGYDLTRLLIGSEGNLAVITEATLKLTPLAETKITMQAIYRDIHSAAKAVAAIMAQPITPCALEFIDGNAINMVRNFSTVALPENAGAMLMIEVDGPSSGIENAAQRVADSAANDGLVSLAQATSAADTAALWATRKALSPALRNVAPKKINEDVVVPVSHIPELIEGLQVLAEKHRIKIVNFGHAGNGNIHVNLLVNPDDPAEMKAAHACLDEVFSLVLTLNGSLSGEHGVGIEKRDYIDRELDATSIKIMHEIKRIFDPQGLLNRDKTLPLNPV